MDTVKCKTCDTGTLVRRKKYRMSGVVVVIGYILLIPSVIGILVGGIGLVSSGAAGKSGMQTARTRAEADLRAASVPAPVISKLTEFRSLVASDTASLNGRQRAAIREANLTLTASAAGTGIGVGVAAGVSIFSCGHVAGWRTPGLAPNHEEESVAM